MTLHLTRLIFPLVLALPIALWTRRLMQRHGDRRGVWFWCALLAWPFTVLVAGLRCGNRLAAIVGGAGLLALSLLTEGVPDRIAPINCVEWLGSSAWTFFPLVGLCHAWEHRVRAKRSSNILLVLFALQLLLLYFDRLPLIPHSPLVSNGFQLLYTAGLVVLPLLLLDRRSGAAPRANNDATA